MFGNLMKITFTSVALLLFAGTIIAPPSASDRVTFYQVPLVCSAAPAIGCGSRAKPILVELERSPLVAAAWLNNSGTIIAVVWREAGKKDARTEWIKSTMSKKNLPVAELTGDAHDQALKSFSSRDGWYRAKTVDRLSEQEAHTIAERLVARTKRMSGMSEDRVQQLKLALETVLRECLTDDSNRCKGSNLKALEEQFLNTARKYLSESEVTALHKSITLGFRPLADER